MRDRSNQLHDSSVTVPIPFRQRAMRLFSTGAFANLSAFFIFGCLMLAMIAVSGYAGMRAGDNDKKVRIESTVSGYVIERYERGVDLFRSGNYALAAANFQEVLKYRPDYTAVRPLLATAQMAQTPHPATPTPTAIPVLTDVRPSMKTGCRKPFTSKAWISPAVVVAKNVVSYRPPSIVGGPSVRPLNAVPLSSPAVGRYSAGISPAVLPA